MDKLTFATEEERTKALEGLEDDPKNLDKLEAIRNSEIKPAVEGSTEKPEVPVVEQKPPEKSEVPETFTVSRADLPEGFDSPAKLFKSYGEAQDLIKRQTEFIRTKLGNTEQTPKEQEALARAEKAEQELSQLRGSKKEPAKETVADIATVQGEIQRINTLQQELAQEVESDPDAAYTKEYQKKFLELSGLQTKNLNALTGFYAKAQQEINQTRGIADQFVKSSQDREQETTAKKTRQGIYDEVTALDDPEFKLSKKAELVESDYVQWRSDIALAYYGRPARNPEEYKAALEQLQIKNGNLISKCRMIGVNPEPSDDVKRYIGSCELIDYQLGYRTDPITGNVTRLKKFDPETGTEVPVILESLKVAMQKKRLEEGYYEKKADGAFQQGANSIAAAASRRDQGAVELDTRSDQGQTLQDGAWATKVLQEIDSEDAMHEFRKGNKAKVEELNKARSKIGMDPLTFNEG